MAERVVLPRNFITAFIILTLVGFYHVGKILYRLLFHPLRKVPGPLLARASPLWSIYQDVASDKCRSLHNLHLKYGPIVRVGPDELSFSDPHVADKIYGHDSRLVKAPVYSALGNGVVPSLFDGVVPNIHRERRKALAPVFAKTSTDKEQERIRKALREFIELLQRKQGWSLDMALWCRTLALEISESIFLEENLNLLARDAPHKYTLDLDKSMAMSGVKWYIPWAVPVMKRFPSAAIRDFALSSVRIYDFAVQGMRRYVERFGQKGLTENRAVGRLLAAGLSDDELCSELAGLILAGTEPTGTTMAFALWELARNPHWQEALRLEVLAVQGETKRELPTWDDIKDLKLLDAFVTESLRLHPSAPGSLPRLVLDTIELGGVLVPPGCIVSSQNYTLHRDPTIWPDPDKFDPHRWLEPVVRRQKMNAAYRPFSSGVRGCIGMHLANMVLKQAIATVVVNLHIGLGGSVSKEEVATTDYFAWMPKVGRCELTFKALS